jgi:lipopolysaccharide assembly outer membrane protein LptD (OstA)
VNGRSSGQGRASFRRSILIDCLGLIFLSVLPPPSFPQQAPPQAEQGEFRIFARDWEKRKDKILASGNVEIHYKALKLFADRVDINPETKDAFAEGHVTIVLPEEVITAEKAFLNLDDSRGKLEKAYGMIQPTISYEAQSIERKGGDLYSLLKAQITSCTQPTPRWKFSFSKANFKKDDYVEMWNAVFRIKKIPFFYLPYMRYPLNKERATGFLTPQIGFSGPKGFTLQQAFYWAIARNMDATLNVDLYSARGLGGGLEYRYLFPKGTGGQLNLYYFNFKKDALGQKADDAVIVRFGHNQPLPFGFSLVADVDYQTSFDFLREFDNNFRRAVVSNRSSQVYLSRSWSTFNLNARFSRFETYFAQLDNSIITYSLPNINFSCFKVKLFSPVYFSFNSTFSRWQYGWQSAYKAKTQQKTQSLSFSPSLTVPFTSIPWLTLNSSATANFNFYSQSYQPNTRNIIDEPVFTKNFVLDAEMTGPVFFKIYYNKSGEPRLKHIIEPFVTYSYDSPVSAAKRIVTAYGFFRYHQITYGLTNRIIVKKDDMPREVFTVGLDQTYYLAPEESPLSLYQVEGKIPKFSEVTSYVRFYPASKYSFDFSAGFNPYYKELSTIRLGANLGSERDNQFLAVSWFKSMNPWFQDFIFNRHQISAWGGIKIPKLSLEFMGDIDFNIEERKMLYSGATVIYHYQCLDFLAEIKVFYFRARPETQLKFSIGLGNIGKTTDFLGGFGF